MGFWNAARGTGIAALVVAGAIDQAPLRAQEGLAAGEPASHVVSLLGKALPPPELSEAFRARQEELLKEARGELAAEPESIDAAVWVGRRLAYLGRYGEALEVYTEALAQHPDSPHLLRHRGHRYITVRELDQAVADLERAAELVRGKEDEIEPDGLPNERGVPTSTLQSNIFYHLGLAHYLKGDFEEARTTYGECLGVSKNPDMQVAATYWLYLTLLRLDRTEEAAQALGPIEREMDVIENHDYHRLLIGYKYHEGVHELWEEASADPTTVRYATVAYGMGAYHLAAGRTEKAHTWFERALESSSWAAFGYIAAEAELAKAPTL